MNETTVRNLTPRELAEEMRYSNDLATRTLALHIIEHEIGATDAEDAIEEAEDARRTAEGERDDLDSEVGTLKELLDECIDALREPDPDSAAELIARIESRK